MGAIFDSLWTAGHWLFVELALFAAVGFVILGADELLVDLLWIARTIWKRLAVYTRWPRAFAALLPPPPEGFRLAVLIPAWREANVIAPMLREAAAAYADADVTLFVGCYPNDQATVEAVRSALAPNIRLVVNTNDGPSTKADNLNILWKAVAAEPEDFAAIVLHDAEDVPSQYEVRVIAHLLPRFALIQLPVVPLVDGAGRWVSGHYCDEFAESHGKTMIVREMVGAGLPLAGVGCAIRMSLMRSMAGDHERPFDEATLTEDYETGVRLSSIGEGAAFVRMLERPGGALVATRAHFPSTLDASITQKARWIIGIGITGWERLGWGRGLAENWMRVRDRLSLLSAVLLITGYGAFLLGGMLVAVGLFIDRTILLSPALALIMKTALGLLIWRLVARAFFVGRIYGGVEALRSIPRALVANWIAIFAARKAVDRYVAMARAGRLEWDKTDHVFPERPS